MIYKILVPKSSEYQVILKNINLFCLFVCCLFRENTKLQSHTHCDMQLDTYSRIQNPNNPGGLISIGVLK